MKEQEITWVQRRGQIKHLLYEMCLTGRIDKATFCEQLQDLNNVEPVVRCKDCKRFMPKTRACTMGSLMYPDESDFCSRGEKVDEVEE